MQMIKLTGPTKIVFCLMPSVIIAQNIEAGTVNHPLKFISSLAGYNTSETFQRRDEYWIKWKDLFPKFCFSSSMHLIQQHRKARWVWAQANILVCGCSFYWELSHSKCFKKIIIQDNDGRSTGSMPLQLTKEYQTDQSLWCAKFTQLERILFMY